MDIYEETPINLLVGLTREARESNIAMKRYAVACVCDGVCLRVRRLIPLVCDNISLRVRWQILKAFAFVRGGIRLCA